ncbi:HEAT repeat domain-containing protein [Parachlamydia sp. AcF125]|uniref:HEAT repeat domain-containing protein n=1 Tax=Parachlamydia sp. AcF125 TaxID=2795736 RepID=UPI001BC96173|nr:HEAT repeat domain-containing protein [Parachlamydia sp. AcF125]MBS4168307.1 hypothetical protein [Parachlamydia sp. AcF125]
MRINVSFLLKADQVSDYIPGVSTITNLIGLFQKYVMLSLKQRGDVSKSRYYKHLQQKSFSRCIVLLIPVIGNIIIGIYDFSKRKHTYKNAVFAATQPVPPSAPQSSQNCNPSESDIEGLAIDEGRQLGKYAKSLVIGKKEARISKVVQQGYSQSTVMAGYAGKAARQLATQAYGKQSNVSGSLELCSSDELDNCEHSLTESFMAVDPDLPAKPGFVNPRASAKKIHLGKHAQLHVNANYTIQCRAAQPLSQAELDPQYLINSLQKLYLSQKTLSIFRIKAEQEWEFKVPLEEIYVRLGIIESKERKLHDQALDKHSGYLQDERISSYKTILESKKNIEIEKLFEHESLKGKDRKRIYLQGAAGSGKSTLCHYIAYRWAKKDLWQGLFAYLFWIPLRNLTLRKYPADEEYTPADLIAKEYAGKVDPRVIKACINDPAFRKETLLILDGYDELSSDAQANTSLATAFKELKELFPHILITSRPGSCSFNRPCELELLGFDKEGISRYIDRFFEQVRIKEKKAILYRLLNSSPDIASLARIPIHLTLLCCLFNEDPEFFNSKQPITMTAIYERMVNWMYKWFMWRRIDQGLSSQTKEKILEEKNLRHNQEVAKIANIFEDMAFSAMERDTLYFEKEEIDRLRGTKITSNELTDCGLIRIPEEKGYFIHLTFQEFLTASKVANQYLTGENRQACQSFVREYKLEPRYSLVLRMIAGYLSLAISCNRCYLKSNALQTFFDDLFANPQDLAVSGELTLIAECFEECQDFKRVKQYDGFIELAIDYVRHLWLLGLDYEKLFRNENFLNHPKIVRTIEQLLSDPKTRKNMLSILISVASTRVRQSLTSKIIELIAEELKSPEKVSFYKRPIIHILKEIANQGGELSKEALAALIQALKEGDNQTKSYVASNLGAMAQQGIELSKETLAALIQTLKKADPRSKGSAANTLREMANQRGELCKEALAALIQAFKEGDFWSKNSAANALGEMANQGGEFSKESLIALIQALTEGDSMTKGCAIRVLGEIANQGGGLSKEALAALIQALTEGDSMTKGRAIRVLGKMANQGGEFSKEALAALIQALKEGDSMTKGCAIRVLGEIASQGGELPKVVLDAFVQALKEGDARIRISSACVLFLREMTNQGGELSKEALAALIQAFKEGDNATKFCAARALESIVKRGGELQEEELAALMRAFNEGDNTTKSSAVCVLGAISEQEGELREEALYALIQAVKEGDRKAKHYAARVLGTIAKQGDVLPKESLALLIQAFKEGDATTKSSAAHVLRAIVEQGDEFSKEGLVALIQALKEGDNETKCHVVAPLEAIVKQGGELSKEALAALIYTLKEGEELTKDYAARALGTITMQGGELSKEALDALIHALKEGGTRSKCSSVYALREVVRQGIGLPKEVLAPLLQALKGGDEETMHGAVCVLEVMAKQGVELPKEVLAPLIQALKEGDIVTKKFAAKALKKFDKATLLKMSSKAFALIAEACFFMKYNFSVKDLRLQISDQRITYTCEDSLTLTYEQIREKLPKKLAGWRKMLDDISTAGSIPSPVDRV